MPPDPFRYQDSAIALCAFISGQKRTRENDWTRARSQTRGAPTATVWGTGTPRREFLFVDDLADDLRFPSREHYSGESHLNVVE
jgi:NAD dependent epimerase/dehydratase family